MVRSSLVTGAIAVAALGCATSLDAHHSSSSFDFAKPTWVKGAVVSYVPGNPHTMIGLELRDERGELQRLRVEGPVLARLGRMNLPADFLQAGDVVEICAFPFRTEAIDGNAGRAALPTLHGHVLVTPDGRLQPWSPYGKLDNCIRPNDSVERWVAFVNTEPMAREYWCNSRAAPHVASVAPSEFVEEINRRLAAPCR